MEQTANRTQTVNNTYKSSNKDVVKCRTWTKPVLAAFSLPAQVSTVGLSAVSQANYMANTSYFIIQADTSYPPGMTLQWGLGCCQRSVSLLLRWSQILPSSMSCRRGSVREVRLSLYQMLRMFLTYKQLCCLLLLLLTLTGITSVLLWNFIFALMTGSFTKLKAADRSCGIFKISLFKAMFV